MEKGEIMDNDSIHNEDGNMELIEGAYYTYTPDPHHLSREGIAIALRLKDDIFLSDTMWDHQGNHSGYVGKEHMTENEMKTAEFFFDPNDGSWIPVDNIDFMEPDDYRVVTSKGGKIKKYWAKSITGYPNTTEFMNALKDDVDKARQGVEDALIVFNHAVNRYNKHISALIDDTIIEESE